MVGMRGIEPLYVLGTEGYSLLPFRSSHMPIWRETRESNPVLRVWSPLGHHVLSPIPNGKQQSRLSGPTCQAFSSGPVLRQQVCDLSRLPYVIVIKIDHKLGSTNYLCEPDRFI